MTKRDRTTPPAADPRSGRNPGYAETRPRDRGDVTRPAPEPAPSPDEPGMTRDPDPSPADDPAASTAGTDSAGANDND
jgi:hypothetical protein